VSVVSNEYVTQNVAVGGGECDALEIALEWALAFRADSVELGPSRAHPV